MLTRLQASAKSTAFTNNMYDSAKTINQADVQNTSGGQTFHF